VSVASCWNTSCEFFCFISDLFTRTLSSMLSSDIDEEWISLSFYVICERQTSFSSFLANFLLILNGKNELGCRFRSPTDL
jgi:hypothetical protein